MKLLRDIPFSELISYFWFLLTGLRSFEHRHGMDIYVVVER